MLGAFVLHFLLTEILIEKIFKPVLGHGWTPIKVADEDVP
jgi:hypothetical protein